MAHFDEQGRATAAKSTTAKRMRVALKGHKNVARKAEVKAASRSKPYQHKYNAAAVSKQIASSSRHGPKIGAREGRAIHALLKGRH